MPRLTGTAIPQILPKSVGGPRRTPSSHSQQLSNFNHHMPPNVGCLIDAKDIVLKGKLGHGTFGEVVKAEWKQPDGQVVGRFVTGVCFCPSGWLCIVLCNYSQTHNTDSLCGVCLVEVNRIAFSRGRGKENGRRGVCAW